MKELSAPNRVRLNEGDIFAYQIGHEYRFIQVIVSKIKEGAFHGALIAYFYNTVSAVEKEVPQLNASSLLIAPAICFPQFFRSGFVRRVMSRKVEEIDKRKHCFRRDTSYPGKEAKVLLVDETGKPVENCQEPAMEWTILGPDSIELYLGKALGLISKEEDWLSLPELPRPLFRKFRQSKGPSRFVGVVFPGMGGTDSNEVMTRLHSLEKKLLGFGRMKELAGKEFLLFNDWNEEDAIVDLVVKKGQHSEFYREVAEAMRSLSVSSYWIADGELGDWLAGSVIPQKNRYKLPV